MPTIPVLERIAVALGAELIVALGAELIVALAPQAG